MFDSVCSVVECGEKMIEQTPSIVVLDSLPLNPGDLDWSPLHALGEVTLHDNTCPEEINERMASAEAIFTNKVPVRAAAFEAASKLKFIGVLATGYDIIDIEAAREHDVTVCNVPSYSSDFTAQSTLALLLELTHHVGAHDTAVRAGQWARANYFSFWNYPLVELSGKTLIIIGLGKIGGKVARIADAMGMRVIAAQLPGREAEAAVFPYMPLEEALPQADVVSLHCPLTPQTRELINHERLSLMKPNTLLVNTARGLLVDEHTLANALHQGHIAGYATDVLSKEPPLPDNPLMSAPRCIITPHLSWASIECRQRLLHTSVANLDAFLAGKRQNVVS